jgi:hypothetical protein
VSQQVRFFQPAAAGERFALDAFDGQIGKRITFNAGDGNIRWQVGWAVLVAAEIPEGGAGVWLTVDVDLDEPVAGL